VTFAVGLISQSTQSVATVNGQRISLSEYQRRARFWYHYYNNFLMPGAFANLQPEQRQEFYQQIADQLIDEVLVRQEAEKQGVSATEDEVQLELEESWFQHFRTPPTPTPSPTADPQATPTEAGTPIPTATPDTEEAFQEKYQEFVENVLKPARMSEDEFRRIVEASVLRANLQTAMALTVPSEEEQVHIRYAMARDDEEARRKLAAFEAGQEEQAHAQHILVDTKEEAEAILDRLEAGEDFAALAAELSKDESNKDQGGDLGWFGRGMMVPEFEQVAFESEIGLHPEPVQTDFGYHVINVLGREERPIDPEEEMIDAGWYGKQQLAERFGPVFAEMVFASEIGPIPEPVPADFGVAIVELLGRQLNPLTEEEQDQRRMQAFESRLDEIRTEGDIENLWQPSMVPGGL
jgi:parvulin-like peptidyl-prolyl isomerase